MTRKTSDETAVRLTRRAVVGGLPLFLAACATARVEPGLAPIDPIYVAMYGPITTEPYPVPAIDLHKVDRKFWRQQVTYIGDEPPGTIVVYPDEKLLYFVLEGGQAIRYGVGVSKEGYRNPGNAVVGRKAEWPHWTPTANMIAVKPELKKYAAGMDGGLGNPLGARALYLYRGGRDTRYRIHGTNEPWTIGHRVSSGCVRMMNQDIIDLYNRAPVGTRVVVVEDKSDGSTDASAT